MLHYHCSFCRRLKDNFRIIYAKICSRHILHPCYYRNYSKAFHNYTSTQNYSYSISLYFYNCFSRKLLLKIIASSDDILWKSKACIIHYSRSTFSNILSNEIHSYSSFCINHWALQEYLLFKT